MNPTAGVLAEAWELYKKHWKHLVSVAAIVYLGVAILSVALTATMGWVGAIISGLVSVVALFWVQGALVKAAEDIRDGRADMSLGETYAAVKDKIAPIALASILAGIGIALGLLFFIVPGLILLTFWVLVIPVIVLEGRGIGAAFGRSRELVSGNGWNVFGVIVLTFLLMIAASIVLGMLLFPFGEVAREFFGDLLVGALTAPFISLTWTLLYYRLAGRETPPLTEPGPPLNA
jgi:hypothetical protein